MMASSPGSDTRERSKVIQTGAEPRHVRLQETDRRVIAHPNTLAARIGACQNF